MWGHSQSEATGAQQTSEKEVRLWGTCYSLLGHARSSFFLSLSASIPLPRARAKPSARVRFMNKSEVSHFKCGPRFPCWQWALKQASVTSNFSPTAMIPNLRPASFWELNDPPLLQVFTFWATLVLSPAACLALQSQKQQPALRPSLYQLKIFLCWEKKSTNKNIYCLTEVIL